MRFMILAGFHSMTLYDRLGKEVFNLSEAAEVAEATFGEDWKEVFNGEVGVSRKEYLEKILTKQEN